MSRGLDRRPRHVLPQVAGLDRHGRRQLAQGREEEAILVVALARPADGLVQRHEPLVPDGHRPRTATDGPHQAPQRSKPVRRVAPLLQEPLLLPQANRRGPLPGLRQRRGHLLPQALLVKGDVTAPPGDVAVAAPDRDTWTESSPESAAQEQLILLADVVVEPRLRLGVDDPGVAEGNLAKQQQPGLRVVHHGHRLRASVTSAPGEEEDTGDQRGAEGTCVHGSVPSTTATNVTRTDASPSFDSRRREAICPAGRRGWPRVVRHRRWRTRPTPSQSA